MRSQRRTRQSLMQSLRVTVNSADASARPNPDRRSPPKLRTGWKVTLDADTTPRFDPGHRRSGQGARRERIPSQDPGKSWEAEKKLRNTSGCSGGARLPVDAGNVQGRGTGQIRPPQARHFQAEGGNRKGAGGYHQCGRNDQSRWIASRPSPGIRWHQSDTVRSGNHAASTAAYQQHPPIYVKRWKARYQRSGGPACCGFSTAVQWRRPFPGWLVARCPAPGHRFCNHGPWGQGLRASQGGGAEIQRSAI